MTVEYASCGDGFVQSDVEECDDGNQGYTDQCNNDCEAVVCRELAGQQAISMRSLYPQMCTACDPENVLEADGRFAVIGRSFSQCGQWFDGWISVTKANGVTQVLTSCVRIDLGAIHTVSGAIIDVGTTDESACVYDPGTREPGFFLITSLHDDDLRFGITVGSGNSPIGEQRAHLQFTERPARYLLAMPQWQRFQLKAVQVDYLAARVGTCE